MKNLLLIGSGGHANSCIDVIESSKQFKIVGILCDKKKIGEIVLGYEILGRLSELPKFREKYSNVFIGIGQIKDPNLRIKLFQKCKKLKFKLPKIISSKAIVSKNSKIGDGSIIHHLAIINANSKIGNNCIINSKALIEHDVIVENNCHISTNSVVNGNCFVGKNTFIGSSAVVSNNVKIKSNSFIKLGSTIKN